MGNWKEAEHIRKAMDAKGVVIDGKYYPPKDCGFTDKSCWQVTGHKLKLVNEKIGK